MDKLNKKEYQKFSDKKSPKPKYLKNIVMAFLVGGIICAFGQVIINFLKSLGLDEKAVGAGTSIILVFLGAILTGLGVYDKIGKVGGAGAAIPITGFANAIVSPAMEYKREGFIFGVAAKMFTVAGPVLVYGIGSSVIVGLLSLLFRR
ncbi:stage V sporulation protein AC [Tissierella creatinini]|nr:stage V sporulation protein AC [Tissierella creatinini]TJX67145.1 stage V sporulation protein AC [Soehngenia saccharolytica]